MRGLTNERLCFKGDGFLYYGFDRSWLFIIICNKLGVIYMEIKRTEKGKCPTCNQDVMIVQKGFKFLGIEIYSPFGKTIIRHHD